MHFLPYFIALELLTLVFLPFTSLLFNCSFFYFLFLLFLLCIHFHCLHIFNSLSVLLVFIDIFYNFWFDILQTLCFIFAHCTFQHPSFLCRFRFLVTFFSNYRISFCQKFNKGKFLLSFFSFVFYSSFVPFCSLLVVLRASTFLLIYRNISFIFSYLLKIEFFLGISKCFFYNNIV